MKPMDLTILKANNNTVLKIFKNRCALNPSHLATVVHHIIPRSVYDGDSHRLENLIPLCLNCHMKVHRDGTKAWRNILLEKRENIK